MNRAFMAFAVVAFVPAHSIAQTASDAPIESIVIQGSFLNAGAQSAMKLDAPVRDTPFSVSSYSDSFMKAIETTNVADMYSYMTGIKRAGNTGYDVVIRGMKAGANDRNSILVDGLPGLAGRYGSPPTIGIEHIELVKGPMSVLYGQAQPGGFINLISKKPKATRSIELDAKLTGFIGHGLSLADANGYDVALDATGPVDEKKKFLYRFVADTTNRDLFRFATYERPLYVSPSLSWNIDDATLLSAQFEYRSVVSSQDTLLVAPNNDIWRVADIRTRYQEPGDWQRESGKTLSLWFEHSFESGMKWTAATRSVRTQDSQSNFDVNAVNTLDSTFSTISRRARRQQNHRSYNFSDTNLSIPLVTGPLEHKLLLGINGGRETLDADRLQYFVGSCTAGGGGALCTNIYNPVYGLVTLDQFPQYSGTAFTTDRQHRYTVSRSLGAYASDLISLGEHWKATLGLRSTEEQQTLQELRTLQASTGALPPAQTKITHKVLPLAGLLYQPTRQWTVYGSYSTSYVPAPASSQDATGANPFRPESSKQVEVGVKAENLWAGRLTGTLALFRIEKKDALSTFSGGSCPASIGTCTQQVGKERSQGAELELNARPLENWQLSAGYAYTDATVAASTVPVQVGARLTNVARNSANMWSRYDLASGALRGLGFGVGLTYTGEREGPLPTAAPTATTPNNTLHMPGYALVDLGLYYVRGPWSFNFKVGNVLDKTYYESSGFQGVIQIAPGQPRNVAASMRVMF